MIIDTYDFDYCYWTINLLNIFYVKILKDVYTPQSIL